MSIKKAYCPYCTTINERSRIFEVNSEAEICYCPKCMAKMKPFEGIKLYQNFILRKVENAEKTLYRANGFNNAYCSFAEIIDYEPHNLRALFGRALTLIFMSTLRNSKMKETLELIKSESSLYLRKSRELDLYIKFITQANKAIDEYDIRMRKRLTTRKRFYDVECVKLYFLRLDEILSLKEFFLGELQLILQKNPQLIIADLSDSIVASIKQLKEELKDKVQSVDGYLYHLNHFSARGEPVVIRSEDKDKPLSRYIKYTLNEKETKGHLIKDKIFPDNFYAIKTVKITTPISFVLLAIGLVFTILFFTIDIMHNYVFLILAISCLLSALASLIVHLVWLRKLKKPSHLLLN